MSASPRRLVKGLLLLVLPVLTVVAAEYNRAASGAFFFGPNQDPSYTYLIGSLRIAAHGTTAFYHHPGLPTQGIGAVVLAVTHRTTGRQDDLTRDVLTRPESYLRAIQLTTLAAVAAALAAVGFLARRRGDTVAALLLQTSPMLGALSLVNLCQVGPESALVFAAIALGLVVWHFATAAPGDERAVAVAFGAIAAFAFTTRVSALLFVLVPPLVLATWRGRAIFAAIAAIGSGLAFLLLAGHWRAFFFWVLYQGRRSGSWGSNQRDIFDPGLYAEGIASLYHRHHAFFAALGLAAAVWLWHQLRHRKSATCRLFHRALGALLIGQVVQVLLVSKNPAGRYLVPATALAGLDLALAWVLLTGGTGWARSRRRVVLAALLLVLPVALELPRHRGELGRLRRGVEGQGEIAAEITRLPADCTVAEFFRASSLPFALHFGNRVGSNVFARDLAELYPRKLFYNYRRREFEGFAEPIPAAEVARENACLALHGHYRPDLEAQVIKQLPVETLYLLTSLDTVVGPKTSPD